MSKMKPCEKVKNRPCTVRTSGYRYGCDLCAESVLSDEGGVAVSCTEEIHRRLYCPYDKCPYAEEIEAHSKRHYDEYDKYVIAKWRKK